MVHLNITFAVQAVLCDMYIVHIENAMMRLYSAAQLLANIFRRRKKIKDALSYNSKYPVKLDFDFLHAAKQQRVRDEPCGTECMMLD